MYRIWTLLMRGHMDLLWIEKEALPWIPWPIERVLLGGQLPYVVDYDDATFQTYDRHRNAALRFLLRGKLDRVMRHASVVVAGNAYLAHRAECAGARRVVCLPSVVDLSRYARATSSLHLLGHRSESFTVGWVGSPATSSYLDLVRPALRRVSQAVSTRLVIIGGGSDLAVDLFPIQQIPWSEQTEVANIQSLDVGIMPLPDNSWTRGKCGYKLIQYMASYKPTVASPVGVNSEIIRHGIDGFLANTTEEWVGSLLRLAEDRECRLEMGAAGRQRVESTYSLGVTAPQLVSTFESVVEAGSGR